MPIIAGPEKDFKGGNQAILTLAANHARVVPMRTQTPAIEIENLQKHFGRGKKKVKAIDGISFSVRMGEIFGFLGPNGAGKTTTIRCLMDFIRPTSGSVRIFGKDAQQAGVELKSEIGYLSGSVRLHPNWTGKDHISYLAKLNGGAPRAEELIERLDFNPRIKTKKLSSGNRQKLGIILALMHNPDLIVLDEPTNALDPLLQQTVYALLAEAKDRGATVFMSSHNLNEVERICDRVAIVKGGKLLTTESIAGLRAKRLCTVKARFSSPVRNEYLRMVPNATLARTDGMSAVFRIRADVVPALRFLCQLPLRDIETQNATLEEMFMEHYQD